jgi:5-enolpyruvylshikimate-3-phosphate synthase
MRFLTAACTLGRGTYALDGVPRMRQRPIGQLVDVLQNLGARIEYVIERGFPPLRVHGDGLPGGIARFGAGLSSQFLSAILMAAPYARNEVRLDLDPPLTSWPYVAMTMRLMDEFGLTSELLRDPTSGLPKRIVIPSGGYRATSLEIEPDATAASYFLAAAAINEGSKVTIDGLGKRSLQGDVEFGDASVFLYLTSQSPTIIQQEALLPPYHLDLVYNGRTLELTAGDEVSAYYVRRSDYTSAAGISEEGLADRILGHVTATFSADACG